MAGQFGPLLRRCRKVENGQIPIAAANDFWTKEDLWEYLDSQCGKSTMKVVCPAARGCDIWCG